MNTPPISDTPVNRHAVAVALLVGAAVGAAAGLLLAPKSGSELRGAIAGAPGRLRQRAIEASSDAIDALSALVEKGRDTFTEAREAAQEHIEDADAAVPHAVRRRSHATTSRA